MQATERFLPPVRLWAAGLAALVLAAGALAQGLPPAPLPPVAAGTTLRKLTVSVVNTRGNFGTTADKILHTVKTKPGSELSQPAVDEDVRLLYQTGLFLNVRAEEIITDNEKGLVEVDFVVVEKVGHVEEIVYNGGEHLKLDELKNITGLRKGDPMSPWRNNEACRSIVEELYKQGRPFATCRLLEGNSATDSRVVFDITEGPKVKVRDIDFTGNTFVSAGVLRNHVKSSREFLGVIGGTLNLFMVEYDVEELEKYYKSFGYHDVHVGRELRWEPDGQHIVLVFHVEEGVRYRIAARPQVDIMSPASGPQMPPEVVQAIPRDVPGEFYSQATVDGSVRQIQDYYGYTGRDVRVKPEPVFLDTPGMCTMRYQVFERPPSRVGNIYVAGNTVTKQNVILRQLPEGLSPGQVLQYPDIRVGERNLARLGIFDMNPETGTKPSIEVLNREVDEEYKDLLVRVDEMRTGSLMFGVGVNSDAGLTGSIVLNEKNFDITRFPTSFDDFMSGRAFRGAGQELRLEAVPGDYIQRYSATWREPFLFDSQYSLSVGAYYYQQLYDEYTESRLGTRVTLGRKLNQYWSAYGSVRVEDVGVHSVPPWDPPDYQNVIGDNFLVGLKGGVTRDTRDSYLRATEGSLLDMSYEEVTGDFTFPSVNVEFSKFFTTYQRADGSGRHVLAYHGQASWVGDQAPVYERFFAGGFRSMRGFQFRGISPETGFIKVGGDFMMLNSLEYQIPVKADDHVYLVGFIDTGTVEPRMEIKDYRVSAGFGIRFVVPMMGPVPIALDFGFPIVKGPGDREQVFSFWVGFFH